ncbi:Poly(beta-D-mannuronate) C5 epimerase 2 [Paenibacillus konkukensis]|uniref:Poly(Beta-D-mannuronate) C5 epimerase 2 n=1 Tax=Paenibacillus konkukensis TaxID=2020716 RepID=A0ABY4RZT4_9BACL|nr:right-handed parallel beta-helix repeat-containing protein [Paenibacillus konkukensis]UQZ87265.1 Poly(beta-D-mannuronate) C5 epimerase 2 [Paenibacillus konkukensis]
MSTIEPQDNEGKKPMTRRQLLASVGAAGVLLAAGAGLPVKVQAAKSTVPVTDNKPWYNVKDFGAVGEGLYDDDAPYIQAAIDAAASKGGTVYFPPGSYCINRGLIMRSKVHLLGAGAEVTELKAGDTNLLMLFSGGGVGSYSIDGITFSGRGPSGATGDIVERGIHMLEGSHITISRCIFTDSANGVRLVRSRHVTVTDCTFLRILGSESPTEGFGIVLEGGSNHIIKGNHFKNVTKSCICLNAGSSYSLISNNVMEQCQDAAILMSSKLSACSYHLIEGNLVTSEGLQESASSSTYGIRLKDACSNNTIVNNVITRPEKGGIQLEAGDNAGDDRPYGNTITGNTVNGTICGIAVINGDANSVKHNEVRRVQTGILLNTAGEGGSSSAKRNVVTGNSLYQCSVAAVKIASAQCESNSVFGNAGYENAEGLADSGTNTATEGF